MWVQEATKDMDAHLLSMVSEQHKTVELCKRLKADVDELSEHLGRENPESLKRCRLTSLSEIAAKGADLSTLPSIGHIFRDPRGSSRSLSESVDCTSEASQAS